MKEGKPEIHLRCHGCIWPNVYQSVPNAKGARTNIARTGQPKIPVAEIDVVLVEVKVLEVLA